MAKDTSLYVQKKIPTFEEYKQRREEGESHEHILAQTVQEREEYHQSLPFDYYSVPSRIAAQRQDGYDELRQLALEATGTAQNQPQYQPQKEKSAFSSAVDRLFGVDSSKVTGEKTKVGDLLKGMWSKGWNQWNALNWKTANFLFGDLSEDLHALGTESINGIIDGLNKIPGVNLDYIGPESKDLVKWGYEDSQAGLKNATEKYAANANSSRTAQLVDSIGTSTVAAIPLALEAIILAPAQAAQAGTATTQGLQYFSGLQSARGMEAAGMMAKESMKKLSRNPQFWTSYLQVAGDGYEDALEEGMNNDDAAIYGLVNGFVNAVIEIGGADETLGGIQNLPMRLRQLSEEGGKHALVDWFKDAAMSEGLEEVQQGIMERALKAPFSEEGVPIASLDINDQDAIFNPWTAAQEFTGGAAVGLLLGGGQTAVDRVINRGANAAQSAVQSISQAQQQREQQSTARRYVQQVVSNMDVPEAAQRVLVEGMDAGEADPQTYAQGIQEAFRLGEMGLSYEQAVENAKFADRLNEVQFRHAFDIGAQKAGHAAETVESTARPVNMPEYESIEAFSREFQNPQQVSEIYDLAPETDVNEFAAGFRAAYDMGQSGLGPRYLTEGTAGALTEEQRAAAYELGRSDAEQKAVQRATRNMTQAKEGTLQRRKGTVKGEGVSMADLKAVFNDRQNTAYRLLTRYAETTGVNIVLYNSQADAETGLFPDAQGRFQWKDDTIYIDINSGLEGSRDVNSLGKYTMMRTFAHEFTHFVEKWNPKQYNEFREYVFSVLESRGENVHDLVEAMQARDASGKMSYEQASREVVADSMMDVLQDSTLVQQLATEHQTIFRKLLQKLREFSARMKQYYREISTKAPREAEALKENGAYLDGIVHMWDEIAKGAVENYQLANGEEISGQEQVTGKKEKASSRAASEAVTASREASQASKTAATKQAEQVVTDTNVGNIENDTRRIGLDFFRAEAGSYTAEAAPDLRQMAGVQKIHQAERSRFAANDFTSQAEADVDIRQQPGVQRISPVGRERFAGNDFTSREEAAPDLKGMVPRRAQESAQQQEAQAEAETPAAAETAAQPQEGSQDTPNGARLRARLDAGNSPVIVNGFEYAVTGWNDKTGTTYTATVRRVKNNGAVPVYDAKNLFHSNFQFKEDAIEALVRVAENNHLLEEATPNVETVSEVHDGGRLPVSPAPVREGDSGVLDGTVPEDVRGVREGTRKGQPVQENSGSVGSSDVAGVRPGTDRNEQAGDRRGNQGTVPVRTGEGNESDVTPEEAPKLIETNETPEAEQRQTKEERASTILAGNFSIPEKGLGLPKGEKARFKANLEAIRIVKECQLQGREATAQEQEALSKYVGWGGLKNVFAVNDPKWAKEQKQLKALLTEDEYEAAARSMLDAFYTEPYIVRSMYKFLADHGVTGGALVEPSCGTGNFIGAMPESFREGVHNITVVELDPITASIAKYLYPRADVRNSGFESTNIPENSVDVIVGNVPFGDTPIVDTRYKKDVTSKIHNYFIVRSLDLLKPGGVAMLITSSRTMNERSYGVNEAKKEMMKRADFLGAIRLPNSAFSENAGTEVVADILLFRKRAPGKPYRGEAFMDIKYERTEDGKGGFYNNEYFMNHKEMVLGTTAAGTRGYNSWTVNPKPGSLEKQLDKALATITTDLSPVVGTMTVETIRNKNRANRQGKPRSVVKNGEVYTVDSNGNEVLNPDYVVPEGADKKSAAVIEKRKDIFTRAISLRDVGRNLIQLQLDGADTKQIETARKQLNKDYDEFVKKYGFLNSASNRPIIWNDEDFAFILALEKYDSTTKKATKADIFSVNTVSAARPQTRANTAHEAVVLSMNTRAYLDMGYMSSLLGISESEVEKRLIDEDLAYYNNGRYEEASLYLSGDVRQKLKQAQSKAETDERYVRNVEALKKVIPKDIPADIIKVTIGSPWVPLNVYAQFLAQKIGVDEDNIRISYNQETKKYEVSVTSWSPKNNELGLRSGMVFKSYSELYGALFSGKPMQITTDGKLNVTATKAAQSIQRQIQSDFQKWLWSDETRRTELGTLYNELFNGYVEPTWSGEGITVPGLRAGIELKPHQKKAIQHAIQGGGNILLQHATGAGKTLEMESIAILQRSMGIIQKPCFVVPNNVIDQWDASFRRDFPNAKVISTAGGAFAAQKRQAFLNKVQTGDWDAVIMTYENFKSLPVSDALHAQYVRDELAQLRSQLEQARNSKGKGLSPRDIEKKIAKKKAELEALLASAKRQKDIETFDGLGFDALFVDEAHNLKKLAYETTFSRVMGLNDKEGNATTADMLEKVRLLQKRNGGRGIVFATATPIMNSMVELYTFQQFLTPETLASLDLTNADNWFKQFGVLEDIQETAADGSTPKTKTAMVRYQNIPELSAMYRRFADVELHPPVGKLPTMKGGKINVIELEPTNYQRWYMSHLPELLSADINPMTVYMLGRNVSISRALTDKGAAVEEGEKIYRCCEEVYREYKDKAKQKGTQIIFLDAGVPGGVYDGVLYKAVKNRLIELGIPEKEIAFIQDWDKKKDALSDKMNSGEIRVLLGSYEKAGVGLNVQSRLSAIQLLDVPHRPGDLTQAIGRGIRQGNMFDEVAVNVYVTKETFDTKSWRNVQRKSAMISSIENGSNTEREMDDSADLTTNSAEIAAIASGDTRLQRQFALNNEIQSLYALQTSWAEKRNHASNQIAQYESQAAWLKTALVGLKKDAQNTQDMTGDKFTITLGGKIITDRTNAGKYIINKRNSLFGNPEDYTEKIGSFAGFDLYIKADNTLILRGAADHTSKISESPSGTMVALTNTLNGMAKEAENAEKVLGNIQRTIPSLRETSVAPFEQADELAAKERELGVLEQDLADNPPKLIKSDPMLDALYGGGISYTSRAERENAEAAAAATEDENNVQYSRRQIPENSEDEQYSSRALVSDDTIEKWLKDYAASNPNYAQAYIAYMSPQDFLRMTTSVIASRAVIEEQATGLSLKAAVDFSRGQPIQLNINSETGKVEGHEGRHRMVTLRQNGISAVPVLLFDSRNKYSKTAIQTLELTGQDFNGQTNYQTAFVHDLQPLSRGNATTVSEKFSEPTTTERIADKYGSRYIVEFSTRQRTISNREVLSMAAEELDGESLNDAERNALQIFRDNLTRLEEEQDNRQRLGREYKDQQFTKGGSRQEADRIRASMSVSDSKIKALENRLLSLENKEVLKGVLEKARAVVESEERKRGDETLKRYRERRNESMNTRKYRERVRAEVETLRKWLVSPSNKDIRKHVPAEIQKTVADFLESINLMSKTALRTSGLETTKADEKYLKNMKKMRDAIKKNVDSQGLYSGYADLPSDFIETFEALISKTEQLISQNSGGFVVNQMSAKELQELTRTLKTLRKFITTMNAFHNNAVFQHTYEAGEETIEHLTPFEKSRKSGTIYKFLRFDYMRPSYAFEHFGKGGQSIEKEFREGQATQARLANRIIDFAKKTYTAKEVKTWSETVKSFTLSGGEKISLPITHIMSLYCLNKRAQALTHIYGDGIRVANYTEKGKVQLDEGHLVSLDDVQQMISTLSPRQREVADALQKYMSTECATWGNYVSMKRFDVEQFGEENYFPINSDGRYLPATADESPDNSGLYALLNMGFTKELKENASNRIILYNIFDVFANHTASMTQYRSFALPVLDALKWFNYKNDTTSVRTKLSSAFGAPVDERAGSGSKGYAESFVLNLIRAYNGTAAQGDPYDTTMLKMLHRFNGAQIAYNLRVVVQQPTAITRAAMILSPAKLSKGLGMSIVQMRKQAEEMEQHSGIAAWKALGFYDTNISRGLTELIKQNPSVLDNVMEVGTKGAEYADRFTWAAMWYAAKDSVKRSDYKTEAEYFKAVTDLFEDVIYKTQVVDSLLTKAEFLRSKGGLARQLGSFMSEPSATMSMLADAHFKYTDDLQRGLSRSEAWQRNGGNIAKTAAVYAVGQVILSAMLAVIDAWRDDDEYDRENWLRNYLQKYLNAFKGNVIEELLPFGKVPIVSELYEVLKGWLDYAGVFEKLGLDLYGNDISSGLSMYLKYIDKAMRIIIDKTGWSGNKTNYTNYGVVYNLIRGVSNLSGMPFGTAWRELEDIWNNTAGYFVPRLKLKTYERAADRKRREGYDNFVKQTGMAESTYNALYNKADTDGDGIEQGEFGPVLLDALQRGEITEEQAAAAWKANWNKDNSTTFEKWRSKNGGGSSAEEKPKEKAAATTTTAADRSTQKPTQTAAPKPAAPEKITTYEQFREQAHVYDTETTYNNYRAYVEPAGIDLDTFTGYINAADTDDNGSVKQDELGVQLFEAIRRREISEEQAQAMWYVFWNKPRSKTFRQWAFG